MTQTGLRNLISDFSITKTEMSVCKLFHKLSWGKGNLGKYLVEQKKMYADKFLLINEKFGKF